MRIAAYALLGVALGLSGPVLASCDLGCPTCQGDDGAVSGNRVVEGSFYSLSNNAKSKFADRVTYTVTPLRIGPTQARQWKRAPDLPASETPLPGDYTGARAALKIDCGHQATPAPFTSLPNCLEANYLSNITPQATALNQDPWQQLESVERALVRKGSINAHAVTGPFCEHAMEPLPRSTNGHVVPSEQWKVGLAERADTIGTGAFVMPQDTSRSADYCNQAVPIEDTEERARLHLFPKIPDAKWWPFVKVSGSLLEALGCRVVDGGRAGAQIANVADA